MEVDDTYEITHCVRGVMVGYDNDGDATDGRTDGRAVVPHLHLHPNHRSFRVARSLTPSASVVVVTWRYNVIFSVTAAFGRKLR